MGDIKNARELADLLNASDEDSSMVRICGTVEVNRPERDATGFCYTGSLEMGYVGIHELTGKKVYTIGSDDGFAMTAVIAKPWEPAEVQATLAEMATGQTRPCVLSYGENIMINKMPAEIRLYLESERPRPLPF